MKGYSFVLPALQLERHQKPYDRSFSPEGEVAAEFYRRQGGFLLRFPEQADFEIDEGSLQVRCRPVPELPVCDANSLFQNSVRPLLGNYSGRLNLHASGVTISGKAAAFVGISGAGKTTLAAAFACAGHQLLTEDVLELEKISERFFAAPSRPIMRLFPDSASFLFGRADTSNDGGWKQEVDLGDTAAFASETSPLTAIFLLGSGQAPSTKIELIPPAAALAELIRHSFILDVEDKRFMRSHFMRLSNLAEATPCYLLDYPRRYDGLPSVIEALVHLISSMGLPDELN